MGMVKATGKLSGSLDREKGGSFKPPPFQTPWCSRLFGDGLRTYPLLAGITVCVHGL